MGDLALELLHALVEGSGVGLALLGGSLGREVLVGHHALGHGLKLLGARHRHHAQCRLDSDLLALLRHSFKLKWCCEFGRV